MLAVDEVDDGHEQRVGWVDARGLQARVLFAERRQLAHGVVVQGDPERPSVAIK